MTGHRIKLQGFRLDKNGKPVKTQKRISRPAQYAAKKKVKVRAAR